MSMQSKWNFYNFSDDFAEILYTHKYVVYVGVMKRQSFDVYFIYYF